MYIHGNFKQTHKRGTYRSDSLTPLNLRVLKNRDERERL